MRLRAAAVSALILLGAGCGGGSEGTSTQASTTRSLPARASVPAGSLESIWKRPGADVGLIQGTSDYAPGNVRVTFLVLRSDGRAVERPRARVWLARTRRAKPFFTTQARLDAIGVPGGATAGDVTQLYLMRLRVPAPGRYWFVAEPAGGQPIQGLGTLEVKQRAAAPPVGSRAFPSRTPTIASTGGDFRRLTTSTPPDRELLRHSVAESLAARTPFVVAFATPKYCASRTCGPTVDVVEAVRRRFARSGVRFIHVEIFERNDPNRGVNQWVEEWRLPTEPWIFVVGADGRIADKFEGGVTVDELDPALARLVGA